MMGNELNDYQKAEKWLERYEFECDQEADGNLATICEALQEIWQYQEIGTVGECREARERQKAKKPLLHRDTNRADCPVCGGTVRGIDKPFGNWCSHCGQAIDWTE